MVRYFSLLLLFICTGCSRPIADVSAADLSTHYRDGKLGDELYKGRIFTVCGVVQDVNSSWINPKDYICVVLHGSTSKDGVACHFSPNAASQATGLYIGEAVIIRGKCHGEIFKGIPNMYDCEIVR